ncbi:WbqC-like protein family protein [Methanophagales archaeon]|nr:WbqC-like protein family protein [Methanophagales archaeon]
MIIAIHQPNYLPYLGFFDKMTKSDIFVIYDNAQFEKGDFQHRNRIRIYHGWKWLTVPVDKKTKPINEIKIKNEVATWKGVKWVDAHFKDIKDNYKDVPYYSVYEEGIRRIYERRYDKLADLNMELINFLIKAFDINVEILFSSELGFTSKSTERLVEIVETLGGDVYLSGPKGRDYLDGSLFEKKGINVEFQDFKHPFYRQRYKGFIPNMAAIDALFNVGKMPGGEW